MTNKKYLQLIFEIPKDKKKVFDFALEGTLDNTLDVMINYIKDPSLICSNIIYKIISQNKKKMELLKNLLKQQNINSIIEHIEDKNWVKFSNTLRPNLKIGLFFIYSSEKCSLNSIKQQIPIFIKYNNGFGTGQHPTTKGCLIAIQELSKKRKFSKPLEIGSGSGILTVALEKLFKTKITATEYDLQAYETSKNNFKTNKVAKKINLLHQSSINNSKIITNSPYDLIVANILARPIIKFSSKINNISKGSTILVLSGFYFEQYLRIVNKYRYLGFYKLQHYKIDNWITLVLEKRK